ncbi:MAG: cation diffusion facilitator family transporter [Bacteroidota bacterium]|nr:cation diffusion facilitator family transporter [Bacteroidota bacterium]
MNKKVKIARLSVFSNSFLIVIKVIVGILSGSVSIISEAIHSCMDLIASVVAFFSVKISDTPADEQHPYGHGKFENVSGVIEAILIFIAAVWIIVEAAKKILAPQPVESLSLGFIVMFVSAAVNFIVSQQLYKVAKETDSIALEADALHLKTDVYTSAGVGLGLLLIWLTGLYYLDPVVAILVALFILREAYFLLKNAYFPLLDTAMPDNELQIIYNSLKNKSLKFHDLKTRKAGHYRFADLHLELPENLSLKEVHDLCDEVEDDLKQKIKNLEITIHAEPVESK